jgi:hypothetical protein
MTSRSEIADTMDLSECAVLCRTSLRTEQPPSWVSFQGGFTRELDHSNETNHPPSSQIMVRFETMTIDLHSSKGRSQRAFGKHVHRGGARTTLTICTRSNASSENLDDSRPSFCQSAIPGVPLTRRFVRGPFHNRTIHPLPICTGSGKRVFSRYCHRYSRHTPARQHGYHTT